MTLPPIDADRRLPQGVVHVSPHLAELTVLMAKLRSGLCAHAWPGSALEADQSGRQRPQRNPGPAGEFDAK